MIEIRWILNTHLNRATNYGVKMLAKVEGHTQLSIPEFILKQVGSPDYLHIELDNGRIILTPPSSKTPDEIRDYLGEIGITEQDVEDAISWARGSETLQNRA